MPKEYKIPIYAKQNNSQAFLDVRRIRKEGKYADECSYQKKR